MSEKKPVEVADTAILDELKGKVAVLETKLVDAEKASEKLQGELDAANAKIQNELSDEAIEARIQARMELLDKARKLFPDIDAKGKSDVDVKAAAILHVNDGFELEGKSAEYVDGMFESMVSTHKESDVLAKELADSSKPKEDDARAKFVARGRTAYKGTK